MTFARLLPAILLVATASCATTENELGRAREHFEHDQTGPTLAILRALEHDWQNFDARHKAQYLYLRGMTDYRVGYYADARHWMVLALEIDNATPGSLDPTQRPLAAEKLAQLNQVVWTGHYLPISGSLPKTAPSSENASEQGAE
jgi:hypothetical protein